MGAGRFYPTINDIHARLTKGLPGLMPPRFTDDDKGETRIMAYLSKRGYADCFEGLLRRAQPVARAKVRPCL
ncbi:MAG: heme NO-binding domain-containing protein [Solidesulfovibrio sp.]